MASYKYLVVVEQAGDNFSAYAPDVPGCVSAGDTIEETLEHFHEALQLHLEGIFEDGDPAPAPVAIAADFVEVDIEPRADVLDERSIEVPQESAR